MPIGVFATAREEERCVWYDWRERGVRMQQPHGTYGHYGPGHPGHPHGAYAPPGYPPHPGHGHPGYGAAYGFAPAVHPQLSELNSQSTTWLIVAIAGFWLGFGFISGPLAWVFGGRLRQKYRSLGLPPSSSASAAWGLGIATTVLYVLSVLAVVLFLTVFLASFRGF
jgi:hypothetical protein